MDLRAPIDQKRYELAHRALAHLRRLSVDVIKSDALINVLEQLKQPGEQSE